MTTSSSSKRALPCFIALMIITLASGLVLGATYLLTESRISAQAAAAAESSRAGVLPEAARFESADDSEWLSENALDWLYLGYDENGAMCKGWYTVKDKGVYFDSDGKTDQYGNTYYYDRKTGLMAKGVVVIDGDEYHFDEVTGVLIEE